LSDTGFDVHLALSAGEAIAMCEQHRFDAAVVDMFIRGPDGELSTEGGLSLTAQLRGPRVANTKFETLGGEMVIVAISGSKPAMGFDVLDLAAQEGATVVLRKPILADTLVDVVRDALQRSREKARSSADRPDT